VITFFLIGWIILATSKTKFIEANSLRKVFFFLVLILAFFTDEIAFFICPLLFAYILIRDGREGLFNRRLGVPVGITIILIALLTSGFLLISTDISKSAPQGIDPFRELDPHGEYLRDWVRYFTQPVAVVRDLGRSFFAYFLRQNLGYWDSSSWGTIAGASSLILLLLMLSRRPPPFLKELVLSIIVIMTLKSFLLVHNAGVHSVFMPEGTVFPSLLFFSYYYVYCETIFLSMLAGILLTPLLSKRGNYVFLLSLITLIGVSNVVHLRNGPKDALEFHGWHQDGWQDVVKSVLLVRQFLSDDRRGPVYLSIPSGRDTLMKARIGDGEYSVVGEAIPTMYLRSLEKGRAIISLENVKVSVPFNSHEELQKAGIFIDVGKIPLETYDLELIKREKGIERLIPIEITRDSAPKEFALTLDGETRSIVFFVKGNAEFRLGMNESVVTSGEQTYGQSYQILKLDISGVTDPTPVYLKLEPSQGNESIHVVGPFTFTHEISRVYTP
ncbi:hypothetical protein MYX82_14635, partial [Acidobacteria bacterium AH-259-D05]|nr:hypothetical protein [Acidobacteria bacterium AH-259-D05]